ncbi:MAG: recombination protein RecR [Clostridiales bacterium]|nr:recombination protein RecR [Candidatus Apopatousia equi]
MNNIEDMERLSNSFSKLPAVGMKTAQRYSYAVLSMTKEEVEEFASNLIAVKNNVKFCKICGNYSDKEICPICEKRSHEIICVVKEPKDVLSMEKVKDYNGTYHVLHGTLSPLNGKGPDDLNIKSLLERIQKGGVKEVIMATNSDVEGEATSMYISSLLKPFNIKVSKLAQGISMGSDIEYQDEVTLAKALEDRREI